MVTRPPDLITLWSVRHSLLVAAALSWVGSARAELDADAARLADGWAGLGQEIVERRAVFLEPGRIAPLVARASALGDAPCVSVAALAARGREVAGVMGQLRGAFEPPHVTREPGARGVLFVARCGAQRLDAVEAAVELVRARGAVEVVVARGAVAAPHPAELLRDRDGGLLAHPVDPGRPRDPTPLSSRVEAAGRAERKDGVESDGVLTLRASDEGAGAVDLTLPVGCHTLSLLAARGLDGRVADVDAELVDPSGPRVLARDRSEAPDARLAPCVAEPTRARLSFSGAPPGAEVALVRASSPLVDGLPARWPARARAAASELLRSRPGPRALGAATAHAGGTVGTTPVAVDLVPGCQRVVVAASHGEPRAVTLSARAGGRLHRDDGGTARVAGALVLCPRVAERAVVRVEARGAGVAWVLAVFPMTTDPVEAE